MSILTASNISLSFGAFDVFKNVNVGIPNDGKIGLIGPNGIGKTSLLRIMAGQMAATTGGVHVARGRRLGYLQQESVEAFADKDNTVYAEMLTVFDDLRAAQERLHAMEARMAAGDHSPELLAEYGAAQAEFEHAGGYDYELRIKQTLGGLGFPKDQYTAPLRQLSGGQKTRALLARLLLEQPDLLIMDEPTNHLDSDAVSWLEKTLRDWPGALLVVSHDRYFLDNVVNAIWEMGRSGIEAYRGNYSAYLNQRDERWERLELVFEEEKARLKNEIDFVLRNIARASTNARAVGLLKRVNRDLTIIDNFGILGLRSNKSWIEMGLSAKEHGAEEALRLVNALSLPSGRPPRLKVRLNISKVSGEIVLRTKDLSVGYADADAPLFKAPNLELIRGECAGVLGPNGAGKTTFLKTLLGQLPPLGGEARLGASLKIGYFAQAQDALDADSTVLAELQRHRYMPEGEARSYLAQYLFRGEDVYKLVSALSGGERARLALAILALEGANLLLLDEPTNHLDIPAQEVLQEVLEGFQGTILLVSHDRYLVDRLATQIWEVRDGALTVFKGNYREWVGDAPAVVKETVSKARPVPATSGAPAPAQAAASKTQRSKNEARRRTQAIKTLEERIHELEVKLVQLSGALEMAGQAQEAARVRELSEDYAYTQAEIEGLMQEWEQLAATPE
jgi:ATP-binding cassette subfamily F protein 3